MSEFNIAENLIRFRKKRKITQDELADFIGVTKGAVSKWENGFSMPDVMLLPKLASFYDVTVDELLGYEPQLSKEQIRKKYICLSKLFVEQPFEQVMECVRGMIKQYYSCYPFLLQMCVLYLNHISLAKPDEQKKLFEEGAALCAHIIDNCKDLNVCSQAVTIKAMFDLNNHKPDDVIDALEPLIDNTGVTASNEQILTQAYNMSGHPDKAKSNCQLAMYIHLLNLIINAGIYITMNMNNPEVCEETIRRAIGVAELYNIDKLHPNSGVQLYIQAAVFYTGAGNFDKAFEMLDKTAYMLGLLFKEPRLHGDEYFDYIDSWIEKLDLGEISVRDVKIAAQSAKQILQMPALAPLKAQEGYKDLERKFEEVCRNA